MNLKQIVKKELKQDISDEEIERVQKIFHEESYDLKFNNAVYLFFILKINEFANLFYGKKWRFYYSLIDNFFITSDTPIVEWFPEKKRFYGYTIFERKHYLTLFSRLIIEIINPCEPGKRVKRKMIDSKKANYYNFLIANYSDTHTFVFIKS
jgi:hypothetical protein